jgi:hypothetical protein
MTMESLDSILGEPLEIPDEVSMNGLLESVCTRLQAHGDAVIRCIGNQQIARANVASCLATKRLGIPLFIEINMQIIKTKTGLDNHVLFFRMIRAD